MTIANDRLIRRVCYAIPRTITAGVMRDGATQLEPTLRHTVDEVNIYFRTLNGAVILTRYSLTAIKYCTFSPIDVLQHLDESD